MRKRVLIVCLIVVATVLVVTAFSIKAKRQKAVATTWAIDSPNHTYKIVFVGAPASPLWPFTDSQELKNRKVTADVAKNGRSLVQSVIIYDGDAYDSSFRDLYSDSEWLSESVLHLWQKSESQNQRAIAGEILLANESKQPLKYAYINAGKTNVFLLFDIAPGERITLPIRLQHWEEVIGCEGKLDDLNLPYRSEDFSLADPSQLGTRYKVWFDATGCSVTRER